MSVAAESAPIVAEPAPQDEDGKLVAAVRRGDDRAFEALYGRYQRRIQGYVLAMVKDHGRAEDITQDVFVSALRRMRETERPIAFKPWIYEIAKNACIDQFRRSQRAEEVSFDTDETVAPGGLVGAGPTPDAAVLAKQQLDHLCGAFGGLSDTHHEILVLRELEGLSYREIGERMGMSRPAVESTLFRARRRLTEEYDELVTGARCQRIQGIIATAVEGALGTRETRRLARHVAHCQPCRREALAAGVDSSILTHVPLRRRAAEKIAALLPFPALARFFRGRGGGGDGGGSALSGQWAAHAPTISEQLNAGWGKAAAVAAVLIAGVGATGVGTKVVTGGEDAPAAVQSRAAQPSGASERASTTPTSTPAAITPTSDRGTRTRENGDRNLVRKDRRGSRDAAGGGGATDRTADGDGGTGGGGTAPADSPSGAGGGGGGSGSGSQNASGSTKSGGGSGGDGGGGSGGSGSSGGGGGGSGSPAPTEPLRPVTDGVSNTVNNTVGGLNNTVAGATEGLNETLQGVGDTLSGSPDGLNNTLGGVQNTVENTVDGLNETVNGATQGLNQTLNGLLGGGGGGN